MLHQQPRHFLGSLWPAPLQCRQYIAMATTKYFGKPGAQYMYFSNNICLVLLKAPNPVCLVLGTSPLKHPSKSLSFSAHTYMSLQ